uniref:Uncharacterized protein n=1 Tax=Cyprinus carpio TaxID=7962 RepID=A0A8C1JFS2_CYPCA
MQCSKEQKKLKESESLHLHLADPFIQSNLQCIQTIHFLPVYEAMIHFNRLKQALTTIPALGRPQALIVQIIGQLLFLYKQLDTIVQGMPSCLRALAVAAVIEQMAKNMVLSHTLILYTSVSKV